LQQCQKILKIAQMHSIHVSTALAQYFSWNVRIRLHSDNS